jgi:hypothetical protein
MPTPEQRQLRNCLLGVSAAAFVLALASPGAQATAVAGTAGARCNETVTVLELKDVPVTLRFVIRGSSCQTADRDRCAPTL